MDKNLIGSSSYNKMNERAGKVDIGSNNLLTYPFGNGAERIFENKDIGTHIKNLNLNIHNSNHICRSFGGYRFFLCLWNGNLNE